MEQQSGQRRLEYLDILRGFGIIFIVAGHVIDNNSIPVKWLYSFHVPMFFFAAGAVYSKRALLYDIKRRVSTVVIPYFAFGAVELIYWQLLERRFRPTNQSFPDALLGLLCGQFNKLDFNSHLWFLPCFFITVVFYNILTNIGGKWTAFGVSAAMSVIGEIFDMPELFWGLNRVFKYIGFYALGNAAAELKTAERIRPQSTLLKISEATLFVTTSVTLVYLGLTDGAMRYVTGIIGIGGIFIISLIIGKYRPLEYIGRITLVILCVHGTVYRVLLKLISLASGKDTEIVRQAPYYAAIVTAATIAACAGVYELLSRIFPVIIGKPRRSPPKIPEKPQ